MVRDGDRNINTCIKSTLLPFQAYWVERPNNFLFFFNDTATPDIYALSLHDALPICLPAIAPPTGRKVAIVGSGPAGLSAAGDLRSEEHTSELQSPMYLGSRILL